MVGGVPVQEILERCVDLDSHAERTYREMAAACPEPSVAEVFRQMALEEAEHVRWWTELLSAWNEGLLPDIADEHGMTERLDEIGNSLAETAVWEPEDASVDKMLAVAARMEFFMLDSIFGELLDLVQPGGSANHHEAYSRHVQRLVSAIEQHGEADMAVFLARLLKRAYRDQQALAALASRDQLTGLLNRRGLLGYLEQWLAWSARYGRPLGVVLLDIDRFKEINDRYGHAAGDKALQQVARSLERAVRSSDVVGRFGGDEFIIVSPESGEPELALLLDRVVEIVRGTPVETGSDTVLVTVSAGASWAAGDSLVSAQQVVAAADRSLYQAKDAGRNQAAAPIRATASSLV